MSNASSLTDELTGKTGIQTDHGDFDIGDLIVILLDAVLLIYTAWRSYDFLSTTVPTGFEILGLVGLWGLDIGAIAWSLVWIFGSSTKYQDWTSMSFFIIDLVGVILTSITDSLMYGAKDGAMTNVLSGIATVAIPLVVVSNVVAGFIYHMTSPATKARREERKADAAHKAKMSEITAMERDLLYAESYLLAKQDTLDKAVLLAEIKKSQDAVEKSTRDSLRDQIGIRNAASTGGTTSNIDELKARLTEMAKRLIEPKADETSVSVSDTPQPGNVPQATIVPTLQIPPAFENNALIHLTSHIACALNGQAINIGDELVAKKNAERYDIGKPNAQLAFANVSEEDFNTLRDGPMNLPEPELAKGNGHIPDPT
jgi:hypothetical protein